MTRFQSWTLTASAVAVAACLCALLLSARATFVCLPAQFAGFTSAAFGEIQQARQTLEALPREVIPPLQSEITEVAGILTDASVKELRHAVDGGLDAIKSATGVVDKRTGQALTIVNTRTKGALAEVSGVRADLKPTLEAAKALVTASTAAVKDAQDSWDDLYPDVNNLVQSAEVTVTGAGVTMEAVGKAAPLVSASVVGIATAAKREADELTKPQTLRQKIFAWIGIIPRIVKVAL